MVASFLLVFVRVAAAVLVVAPAAGCPLVGGRSARPEVAAGAEPQAAAVVREQREGLPTLVLD